MRQESYTGARKSASARSLAHLLNLTGGLLLVGIGLYDLWLNRELLLAFLA